MYDRLFLTVLDLSLTASWVILAVLLARLLLKGAPKRYAYALWSVVAFRLCCPVSFSSVFSLFRLTQTTPEIPQDLGFMAQPQITTGLPAVNTVINQSLPAATPTASINPIQVQLALYQALWLLGIAVLVIYGVVSTLRLRRRLATAVRFRDHIYQAEQIPSPFILGLFRPRIYIPYGLDRDTLDYVLAHETFHLRHKDHWIKAFAWLLLTVHWFNPLCWLAYGLLVRDMEMRCDEAVLARGANRRSYSQCLLGFASNRRFPAPGPLAFGESSVKTRIKNALRWQQPRRWLTVLAVTICAAVLIACAADPAEPTQTTIVNAITIDMRRNAGPREQTLTAAQIEDLSARLEALDPEKSDEFAGSTPFCHVQAELSDGQYLTINGYTDGADTAELKLGEDRYVVEDPDFCQYLDLLCAGALQPEPTPIPTGTYWATEVLFVNPASSMAYLEPPQVEVELKASSCLVHSRTTGEIIALHGGPDLTWEPLTATPDQWSELTFGMGPDISGYQNPRVLSIGDQGIGMNTLYDMDGDLWLASVHGDYIWSIFRLLPAEQAAQLGYPDLERAIAQAILDYNVGTYMEGGAPFQSYALLGTEPAQEGTTAYIMQLYLQLEQADSGLELVAGGYFPAALTFRVDEDGRYHLTEFWVPEDGDSYADSIRERFPDEYEEAALDLDAYALSLQQGCYAQAVAYYGLNIDDTIGPLFDRLEAGDLAAYPDPHRELLYYGDTTLAYIFRQFLDGGQTGYRGDLMWQVMDDLIGDEALLLDAENGQEYFDAWYAHALELESKLGNGWLLTNNPKMYMLLEMVDAQ